MNSMQLIPPIAAVDPDFAHSHSVMDALPHLGGMLMVLITLACLWALTAIVANLVSTYHKLHPPELAAVKPAKAAAPAAAGKSATAPPAAEHAGVSPEIVAIISAAIACMGGGSRRVISIRPADTSWEKAGRQSVLSSHRIR